MFSGGYVSAGPAFLDGSLPLLKEQLAGSGLTLEDCVTAVSYHAYSLKPENTHRPMESGFCGKQASAVSAPACLASTLQAHVPSAFVFQGECGAPSTWERGGAMAKPSGFNWTEVRQAKWNLRSMIGDAAEPLVRYSSVFSAMDVCYDAAPNNIGNYGLLAATCAQHGKRSEGNFPNKTVDHIKPAFSAVQSVRCCRTRHFRSFTPGNASIAPGF